MRTYYYCEADLKIYTEKEMLHSKWAKGRFEKIGTFKNRGCAEEYAVHSLRLDVIEKADPNWLG